MNFWMTHAIYPGPVIAILPPVHLKLTPVHTLTVKLKCLWLTEALISKDNLIGTSLVSSTKKFGHLLMVARYLNYYHCQVLKLLQCTTLRLGRIFLCVFSFLVLCIEHSITFLYLWKNFDLRRFTVRFAFLRSCSNNCSCLLYTSRCV